MCGWHMLTTDSACFVSRCRAPAMREVVHMTSVSDNSFFAASSTCQVFESANKGPHFWDECAWPVKGACTVPPTGDFEGYINLFAPAAERIRTSPSAITGEASSNTFTSARGVFFRGAAAHRNMSATMPDLLREAQPYLRLVAIFRDPVDRWYSAFYYYRSARAARPPHPPSPTPPRWH